MPREVRRIPLRQTRCSALPRCPKRLASPAVQGSRRRRYGTRSASNWRRTKGLLLQKPRTTSQGRETHYLSLGARRKTRARPREHRPMASNRHSNAKGTSRMMTLPLLMMMTKMIMMGVPTHKKARQRLCRERSAFACLFSSRAAAGLATTS